MSGDIVIGLDYSHNNMLTLEESSYADFTQFLFASGYKIGKIETGFGSIEKLNDYNAIIISTPKNMSLNPKEIENSPQFFFVGGRYSCIIAVVLGDLRLKSKESASCSGKVDRLVIGQEVCKMAWSATEKKEDSKGAGEVTELRPSGKSSGASRISKDRDLAGGMDMLELSFLLGVIESTAGADKNDVMMRKLSFNEVLRRDKQNEIDSKALTVYAVDSDKLYGKDIQCEAMKELTRRTTGAK